MADPKITVKTGARAQVQSAQWTRREPILSEPVVAASTAPTLALLLHPKVTFSLVLTILALNLDSGTANGQGEPTPQQVQAAIDRSISYLLGVQGSDGGWPEYTGYPKGVSCLVVLALLNAGLEPESPTISRGLSYISEDVLEKTYSVSLQSMALCAANPNRYARQIQRNTEWLIKIQSADGGWGYGDDSGGYSDPSNSQFALLALHEAQRVGVDVAPQAMADCFDKSRKYWQDQQNPDGSFHYDRGTGGSGSMTSAGVASLMIVGAQADQLQASAQQSVSCCGNVDDNQQRIEKALNWLGDFFSVTGNPRGNDHHYLYYMYALERVGRLSGRRYFTASNGRQIDWYREGAVALLRRQQESGSFGTTSYGNESSEIALGLLFLAKGKRQVVVNRLEYGQPSAWNQHPLSIQHLTAHTEKAWKRDLAWQVVRLEAADVGDLLEAPVLFISGSTAPNFTREEKLLLKRYVEQGGFVFAESCNGDGCQGSDFEKYFQQLVVELFEAPLEKLPIEHPIWFAESRIDPMDLPQGAWLYGVQTCCRLGVVYSPYSLSCRWELNLPYGNRPTYPETVQTDLDTATRIGLNVLSYASGKELKEKLQTVSVLEEVTQATSTDRGLFVLPILMHNAGADDAPKAVKTLIEWMNQENPFQMSSEKRSISINSSELQKYPLLFMHGRGRLVLNESQRDALRKHFDVGGFLICNAICADEQFAASFREEMQLILGESLKPLDPQHPLFGTKYNGFDIRQLSVIDPAKGGNGEMVVNTRKITPIVEVGSLNGRIVVAFSPLDMSCALESRHSLQCKGYLRPDAARLGINLVLFALQQE